MTTSANSVDIRAHSLALCFAAMLMLGGSSQFFMPNDMPGRLAACLGLFLILWYRLEIRLDRFSSFLLIAIVLLPIVQLIPVGMGIWDNIPGRQTLHEVLVAANADAAYSQISLAPARTVDSLLFLVTVFAGFAMGNALFGIDRYILFKYIVAIALLSVLLSAVQLAQGEGGGVAYLYRLTNLGSAVGIFANRNHNGSLMAIAIASLIPLLVRETKAARPAWGKIWLMLAMALVFLVVAIGTQSRAGAALAGIAFVLMLWQTHVVQTLRQAAAAGALPGQHLASPKLLKISAATASVAVLGFLVWAIALSGIQSRYLLMATENFNRSEVYSLTGRAIADNWLTGTGMGSFQWAIVPYEQFSSISFTYWNHAHSDLLQIVMEGGIVGAALLLLFALWLVTTIVAIYRANEPGSPARVHCFATSLIVAILLTHSLVDYPLRTAALAAIFAMACGVLLADRLTPAPTPPSAT